jgi:hypothetical protein
LQGVRNSGLRVELLLKIGLSCDEPLIHSFGGEKSFKSVLLLALS